MGWQVVVASFHAQDDRTGRKEQQGLEKGVRDQVEHARRISAHADRRHHEAQLARWSNKPAPS